MNRSLPVIINPAAGKGSAVLKELNQVFQPAGIAWSVEVTLGEGDAFKKAQALAAGGAQVVAVYGGDGTISEAATALAGTQP
jgi:diacylglycerol kinase family enzyme